MAKREPSTKKSKTTKTTKSTDETTRKERVKKGAADTFWATFGIVVCVVVVVFSIFVIDWFVYRQECEKRVKILDTANPAESALIGPTDEQAYGCDDYRILFLRNN